MTHTHFIVIRIVGWCYLDRASAELGLDKLIGDYRNLATHNGQPQQLPDHFTVSLVFGIYRHGGIAQHRFRSRGRYGYGTGAVLKRITKIIKFALLRLAQNLEIGKHGLIVRTPIDDAIAAINHSIVVQAHERFAHGARKILVHGEPFA